MVYFGSSFHKDWVLEVLSRNDSVLEVLSRNDSESDGTQRDPQVLDAIFHSQVLDAQARGQQAKLRQRVLVAMRVHGVLPAAGRRAAVVIQRRVREFLLAPARVFDPDAGAHRRAALRLEDSYRAMANGRV